MIVVYHCSDLHLSAETDRLRAYSLAVLDEILERAAADRTALLLIAGDLFDNFQAAEALRGAVRERFEGFSGDAIYVPGNHEELGRGRGALDRLDFGRLQLARTTPFEYSVREYQGLPIELLLIPHQSSYGDFREWAVPQRKAKLRIAVAHGIVSGLAYTGPDEEGDAGAIDPSLFHTHYVDYAALGHIHARRRETLNDCMFSYPGSARVWRSGESGPRGCIKLEIDPAVGNASPEFVQLERAGEYRAVPAPLGFDATPADFSDAARAWQPADFVELFFSGLVEDERSLTELETRLSAEYAGRVRELRFNRDEVYPLPGIQSEPLAKRFLEAWEKSAPAEDNERARRAWRRAREVGLAAIREALNARR